MPFRLVDNVLHIASNGGTGDLDLTSPTPATDGYQSFDLKMSAGDTLFYTIWNDNDYEVGLGTVQGSPIDTLQRTTVYRSSNGVDQYVNFSGGGDVNISCALPSKVLESLMNPSLSDGFLVHVSDDEGEHPMFATQSFTDGEHLTWLNPSGIDGGPEIDETNLNARFARKDQTEEFGFNVLFSAGLFVEADIFMGNNQVVRGENQAGAQFAELIHRSTSDHVILGGIAAETHVFTDGANTFTVDDGSGANSIWHAGNLTPFGTPTLGYDLIGPFNPDAGEAESPAHSLASRPRMVFAFLRAKTTFLNYIVNDQVFLGSTAGSPNNSQDTLQRFGIAFGSTGDSNLYYAIGGFGIYVGHRDGGPGNAAGLVVDNDWELYLQAWL